ncbi:MAG: glycoside hydrolase family 3 C-terminal domain-containing protein [Polyangiaceae bacterium]|nr:glycoside hydrolase family 3 C-terminal domain-containing protein [Polyangiaceae bacterium]
MARLEMNTAARSAADRNRPACGIVALLGACAIACRAEAPPPRAPGAPPPAPPAPPAPAAPVAAAPAAPVHAYPFQDPALSLDERAAHLVSLLTLDEKIAQMTHDAPAIDRLGIPAYSWWNEGLHGVARSGRATVFPQAIALAATFDEQLVHEVAGAIADEARAKFNAARKLGNQGRYAGLTLWSPNINILRDPRWGRGQETYGEDPLLSARMGVAFVTGLQGDDPRILKTAGCAKHFAVHSGPEALRHQFDAKPSKKDLRETYLPAFEALVTEAKVAGVMSAYNRVWGEPASGSTFLLQDVLRNEWGFQGYVVSDCWALVDFKEHHRVTRSSSESAAKALKAGVNLDCGSTFPDLKGALAEHRITEAEIDQALITLLKTRFRLGLFDPKTPYDALGPEIVGSEAHATLARRAAASSLVLLQNRKGALPLSKSIRHLAVIGPYATDGYVLLGNYFGSSPRLVSLLEGITAKLDVGAGIQHVAGFLPDRKNPNPLDWSVDVARSSDATLVTLGISGLMEGEEGEAIGSAHHGDRPDLRLPAHQVAYLKTLRQASQGPIIAVVFGGGALDLGEITDDADAILLVWYPGQEGGDAIADVVFGDVAPSGRLPITFPRSVKALPAFTDYSMARRGYRYSNDEPLYPFGFGLSYGTVLYDRLELSSATVAAGAPVAATATVRNTGTTAVSEVVELYLSDLEASVRVPRAQLVGFRRVALGPGQTQKVSFEIPARAMQLVTEQGERLFEPGRFRVTAGAAAPGLRAETLGSPRPAAAEFLLMSAEPATTQALPAAAASPAKP